MNINRFWDELYKYFRQDKILNVNEKEPKPFIYNNNEIRYPLAVELIKLNERLKLMEPAYDKECDYNRLLRKENTELQEELEYFYQASNNNNDNNIDDDVLADLQNIINDKEEMLS